MNSSHHLHETDLGPHARLQLEQPHLKLLSTLFDRLWETYCRRVEHAAVYVDLLARDGLHFVDDHIAFRTLAWQEPDSGLSSVARPLEALGYCAAACYRFPDKHLNAIHLQPPHPALPKIFVSELQCWELSENARSIIARVFSSMTSGLTIDFLARLSAIRVSSPDDMSTSESPSLKETLDRLVAHYSTLPWSPPEKNDVIELNRESQYGAWVLVHGNNVNHFTASINAQEHPAWNTLEKTAARAREAGMPVKAEIEGSVGSKLRQTATEAVMIDVAVQSGGIADTIPWTYAYLEFAERGMVVDPETGETARFEGFLGGQATHLFEMTKMKSSP